MSDVCTLEKSLGTAEAGADVNEILRNALNSKVKRVGTAGPKTENEKDELIVLSYACARGLHVSRITHSLADSLTHSLTHSRIR